VVLLVVLMGVYERFYPTCNMYHTQHPDRGGSGDADSETPEPPRRSTRAAALRARDQLLAQMLSEDCWLLA